MSDQFLYVQAQNFSLSGSGAILGATSITLKSLAGIDGTLLTMANFGTIGFGTLEPGNGTQEEQICFTGVTQNSSGTATLTGVSSVLFISPYTQTSGLAKTHPGSTTFVISNTAGFYDKLTSKSDDETITGNWNFQGTTIVPDPVGLTEAANKEYVLSVVSGGPITTNALVEAGIAGETVAAGQVLYLKAADGRWWKADASTDATVNTIQLGISQGAGTAGFTITGGVLRRGTDINQSGGSAGALGYIRNGGGLVNTVTGTTERVVGNYLTASNFDFDPAYYYTLTAANKTAIASLPAVPIVATDVQVFIASGTWTKPANAKAVSVFATGAGGGGSGGSSFTGAGANGCGGGGGAYNTEIFNAVSLGATETITVGAGGAGGVGSVNGASGSNGDSSTFGTKLFAGGGGAASGNGLSGGGGGGSMGSASGSSPGTPAASGAGFAGQGATSGSPGSNAENGGGGGGTTTANGGNSVNGGGGGGAGGAGNAGGTTAGAYAGAGGAGGAAGSASAGADGAVYGGGGGGGTRNLVSGNGGSGGTGANGIVVVITYF